MALSLDRYVNTCHPCTEEKPTLKIHGDCCAVCLDENEKPNMLLLNCSHQFHSSCILQWVEQSFTCPLCREEISQFIPLNGDSVDERFAELWNEHYVTTPAKQQHDNDDVLTKKQDTEIVSVPIKTAVMEEELIPEPSEKVTKENMVVKLEPVEEQREEISMTTDFDGVMLMTNLICPVVGVTPPRIISPPVRALEQKKPFVHFTPSVSPSGSLLLKSSVALNYSLLTSIQTLKILNGLRVQHPVVDSFGRILQMKNISVTNKVQQKTGILRNAKVLRPQMSKLQTKRSILLKSQMYKPPVTNKWQMPSTFSGQARAHINQSTRVFQRQIKPSLKKFTTWEMRHLNFLILKQGKVLV